MLEPTALTGVTVNGRITGYPFLVQSHSFIYNKKVFADAGITTLPRTLKEYEDVAQKLQAKGIQALRHRLQGMVGAAPDRVAGSCPDQGMATAGITRSSSTSSTAAR